MSDFDHIPGWLRDKVTGDLLAHLTEDKRWAAARFNPKNDYQRHLYALYLRLAGLNAIEVFAKLFLLSSDVEERGREEYVKNIIHSDIVGFPRRDGSLILTPKQEIVEV